MPIFFLFFFNDTATTEIYTLSLHDALPICPRSSESDPLCRSERLSFDVKVEVDRKSTRLNSSHSQISYAVFCLKKKNEQKLLDDVLALGELPDHVSTSHVLARPARAASYFT